MNKIKENVRISQVMFEVALAIQIICGLLLFSKIELPRIFGYVPYGVLSLLLVRAVYIRRYNLRDFLVLSFSVPLLVLSAQMTGSLYLVSSFSFILLGMEADIDKAIHDIKPVYFTVMMLIIGGVLFGFIENDVKYMYSSGTNSYSYRYLIGFENPNTFSAAALQMAMLVLYSAKSKKISVFRIISAVAVAVLTYKFTRTKTLLVMCAVMVIGYITEILFAENKYTRWIFKMLTFAPIVCCVASLLAIVNYDSSNIVWWTLNRLVSNRLYSCHTFFERFGWTLLGQEAIMMKEDQPIYILDNAYAQLAFRFGVIWLALFIFLMYKTMKKAYNDGRYNRVLILATMSFYGTSETAMILIYFDFALLFLSDTFWSLSKRLPDHRASSLFPCGKSI